MTNLLQIHENYGFLPHSQRKLSLCLPQLYVIYVTALSINVTGSIKARHKI